MSTEQVQKKIETELKEIVLQRILSSKLPENIRLSVGELSEKPMTTHEIAEHIKREDEIGKTVIEMELSYLRALKEGIIKKIQDEQ